MEYYKNYDLENIVYKNDEGVECIEQWKDVFGYEGLYQVSDLGRVLSLNYNHTNKPRLLKQKIDKNGYLLVTLFLTHSKNNKVHRLVAQVFILNPENKPQVNHIKGVKIDNRFFMLEWNTSKENNRHSVNTGLRKCIGSFNPKAKLSEENALSIKNSILKSKELASIYNVSTSTINAIKRNAFWKHI